MAGSSVKSLKFLNQSPNNTYDIYDISHRPYDP